LTSIFLHHSKEKKIVLFVCNLIIDKKVKKLKLEIKQHRGSRWTAVPQWRGKCSHLSAHNSICLNKFWHRQSYSHITGEKVRNQISSTQSYSCLGWPKHLSINKNLWECHRVPQLPATKSQFLFSTAQVYLPGNHCDPPIIVLLQHCGQIFSSHKLLPLTFIFMHRYPLSRSFLPRLYQVQSVGVTLLIPFWPNLFKLILYLSLASQWNSFLGFGVSYCKSLFGRKVNIFTLAYRLPATIVKHIFNCKCL